MLIGSHPIRGILDRKGHAYFNIFVMENQFYYLRKRRGHFCPFLDDELKSTTSVERDFIIYWMEKFRLGDLESATFRRKVIDSFVNAVYLTDDHIRIALNCTGKQNTVDMAIVMDAESISDSLDCSYKLSVAPPFHATI